MRRNGGNLPVRRETDWGISPLFERDFLAPESLFSGNPWQMMRRMQEDMDRMFGQFVGGTGVAGGGALGLQTWQPSVDISQNDREWRVEADLPGVKKEDIDIQVRDNQVSLSAQLRQEEESRPEEGGRQYYQRQRRSGFFQQSFTLPRNADEENISCDFRDGVLTLRIPKSAEAPQRGRRIPIGEGQPAQGEARGGGRESALTSGQGTSSRPDGETGARNQQGAMAGAKGGATSPQGDGEGQKPAGRKAKT